MSLLRLLILLLTVFTGCAICFDNSEKGSVTKLLNDIYQNDKEKWKKFETYSEDLDNALTRGSQHDLLTKRNLWSKKMETIRKEIVQKDMDTNRDYQLFYPKNSNDNSLYRKADLTKVNNKCSSKCDWLRFLISSFASCYRKCQGEAF